MEEPAPKRRKVLTAPALPETVRTTTKPLPAVKSGSPREIEAARTVRPRPLQVNEKIRVLWQGRDPEWDEWDGGAFAKWMQACEDEEQQQRRTAASLGSQAAASSLHHSSSQAYPGLRPQVVVVGHNFKPLAQDIQAEAAELAHAKSGLGPAAEPINVPKCRKLPKTKWRKRVDSTAAPSANSVEERYVRHVDSAASGSDQRVEYDMDDEDEAWLAKYNKQRLLSNSRGPRLSEDAFEGIIDSFEKGLHRVLGQRTELWPNVIEASADAPDIEGIFPLAEACSLPELQHLPKPAVKAAFSLWCSKRLKAKRPLLQRLWFEQPWVRVREASKEHCGAPGSPREVEAELPFMGQDAPRPSTRPRWINADEAMLKLLAIRGDLEVIRTMADQVHRREKQRRRKLLNWRKEWRDVLSMDPAEALESLPSGPVSYASADRESGLANRAAMQAAREASTLIGAQVSLALPSGENAEMPTDLHVSRTASLNGDLALPAAAQKGQPSTRACFWCLGSGSLVACNHCPRCFCYNCYKQRHSYGIINWAKVLKESNLYCPVCTGKEPASNEGDSVPGAERPSATAGQKPASSRWRVGWSFLRGRGRRGRGRIARSSADRDVKDPEPEDSGISGGKEEFRSLPVMTRDRAKQEADGAPQDGSKASSGRDGGKTAAKPRALADPRARVTRASGRQASPEAPVKQEADGEIGQSAQGADASASRRKQRATEATKLMESAKRWERVDGSLAGARGHASAHACHTPCEEAAPLAEPAKAKAGRKEPEGGATAKPASARAGRKKAGQPAAPPDGPSDTDTGPEDVGIKGIQRMQRNVQSAARKTSRTEYLMSCGQHGPYRMDRVSRMADFFAQHSACMPEWVALAQQPGESPAQCDERLRQMFSFNATSVGCPVKLTKAPVLKNPAQELQARPAAAKRKLGTPAILTERQLPENRGRTCDRKGEQPTTTRSKATANPQGSFSVPACQQQVIVVQKKPSGLAARADICEPERLPRRKNLTHLTRGSTGPINGVRKLRRSK